MTSVRVHLNADGIRELLHLPGGLEEEFLNRMRPVLEQARSSAPTWRNPPGASDQHRDSLRIEKRRGHARTTVVVVADAQWSALIEAKTGHMARALDASGGESRGGGHGAGGRGGLTTLPNGHVTYTTRSGKVREATPAQVAHWSRGNR